MPILRLMKEHGFPRFVSGLAGQAEGLTNIWRWLTNKPTKLEVVQDVPYVRSPRITPSEKGSTRPPSTAEMISTAVLERGKTVPDIVAEGPSISCVIAKESGAQRHTQFGGGP